MVQSYRAAMGKDLAMRVPFINNGKVDKGNG